MIKILKTLSLGVVATFTVVGLSGTGVVFADENVRNQTLTTNLQQLNNSGASGTSTVELMDNNRVRVKVNVTGTSPNLPHAQHLHYTVDEKKGDNPNKVDVCPDMSADANGDGLIDTAEGQPSYGEVIVSLTTEGAVDAGSGLAVDRFPVADAAGNLTYERTFDIPEGVSREDITESVVVHHGISELFDDKAQYDGEKRSSLDEELPLEATIPAACGALVSAPVGGVGAGFGPAEGLSNAASLTVGAITLAAAGALAFKRRQES